MLLICLCTPRISPDLSVSWPNTKTLTLFSGTAALLNQSGHNSKVELSISLAFIYSRNEYSSFQRDTGLLRGRTAPSRVIDLQSASH